MLLLRGRGLKKDHQHLVYVLECITPGHYYVGLTKNLRVRFEQHKKGQGSEYTKIHGAKQIIQIIPCHSKEHALKEEKKVTRTLIKKYGINKVAGSHWSQAVTSDRRRAYGKRSFLSPRRPKRKSLLGILFYGKKSRERRLEKRKVKERERARKKWGKHQ